MPLSIHDDTETGLVNVAAVFEMQHEHVYTGTQVGVALRAIASQLHARRIVLAAMHRTEPASMMRH